MRVGLGTLLAQSIAMAASPVLTRVFNADEFGFFGAFISIQGILFVLFTAKYDGAIIVAKTPAGAVNALVLALLIAGAFTIATSLILLAYACGAAWWRGSVPFNLNFCLLPLATFVATAFFSQNEWAIRQNRFDDLTLYRLVNATATAGASLVLGLAGVTSGLVYGAMLGNLLASLLGVRAFSRGGRLLLDSVSWRRLKYTAIKHVSFPKYIVPAQLINAFAGSIPLLFMTYRFGLAEVGFLALADRMCSGPLSIIGSSIRDVFKREAVTRIRAQGNCRQLIRKITWLLAVLSVPPLLVLTAFGPTIFGLAFGAEWIEAGRYARVLSLAYAAAFLCIPTGCLFAITENQRLELVWQAIFLVLMVLSVIIGLQMDHAYEYVVVLAILRAVAYLIHLALNYSLAGTAACRQLMTRRAS